jgi:hypothetical protein
LVELKNFANAGDIRTHYSGFERTWVSYKDALVGAAPTPEGGRKVMSLNEEVLKLAETGTSMIEKQSALVAASANTARLVNRAGRQRMLSQRVAKFHQASVWGVAPADGAQELTRSRAEFADALKELSSAPQNTPAIKDELALGAQQWTFFEDALKTRTGAERLTYAGHVASTSERLLEVFDRVTTLYEKVA